MTCMIIYHRENVIIFSYSSKSIDSNIEIVYYCRISVSKYMA